jgi:hypothetical protein
MTLHSEIMNIQIVNKVRQEYEDVKDASLPCGGSNGYCGWCGICRDHFQHKQEIEED